MWGAFAAAAVVFNTPLIDLALPLAGGWAFPEAILTIAFLWALYAARRREFAADAGAVSLTGDPQAMIAGLAKIARHNSQPLQFGPLAEWFSTHPSTHRRIQAIASAARLESSEIEALCSRGDIGEGYTLPPEDANVIFGERWQAANAARYGWTIVFATATVGIAVMLSVGQMTAAGLGAYAAGIALGCALTKTLTEAVMARGYARLARRLRRKLGVLGAPVGFAPGDTPRLYRGHRFRDLGLIWFEEGRFFYRSERTAIELAPADVIGIKMVPAAPAAWFKLQPAVQFRSPESGEARAFILHPLEFGATGRHLCAKLERWRAAGAAPEAHRSADWRMRPASRFVRQLFPRRSADSGFRVGSHCWDRCSRDGRCGPRYPASTPWQWRPARTRRCFCL